MLEPLYGSGMPMWPGVPSPGFSWLQPSISTGSQLPPTRMGFSPTQPGQLAMLQGQGAFTVPGAYLNPTLGPDVSANTTAPALLAAVAMQRGQPLGPTNDQEIEDFLYDALEVFPGAGEVDVRSESGRVTLTGRVSHKKLKRDVGEIAWATSGVNDVQNNLTIAARRRARGAGRELDQPNAPRKSA